MKFHVYNAGPLFSEADRKQRLYEEEQFKKLEGVEVFNPLTAGNFKKDPYMTSTKIYNMDVAAMDRSNVFFFDLTTPDEGTHVELGMVIERFRQNPEEALLIYPVISDNRQFAIGKEGLGIPKGWNQFMVGSLQANNIEIFKSFDDAYKVFVDDINAIIFMKDTVK